jgi:LacI family repressor for deo operon, udp, cdd, tsx, nupC, and nupG
MSVLTMSLSAKMATEYLISLGHRRIVFISGGPADVRSDLRHSGYQKGLMESAVNRCADWRLEGDGSSGKWPGCGRAPVHQG